MRVISLGRYPVKSFQGEAPEGVEVGPSGADGDRRWALIDQSTGKVLSAKREPRLLDGAARTIGPDDVELTLPSGAVFKATDPAVHQALCEWLDRPVRLERADAEQTRVFEFNISSEDEASPMVDVPCPPGTFLDLGAVHLLTTASLRAIKAKHPEGQWVPARFRPTVVIEADGDEFIEDEWVGRTLTIGGVEVQGFMPTVRCAMTTRAQQDLPRDLEIAKTVNREHGGSLGLYCIVTSPGRIEVGDPVQA